MSLVALKRKTQAKYKLSGGNGFSLNNPRRVHSKSGKDQYQTPMKGLVYRGHGGCCGTYTQKVVKSQYTNSDPYVSNNGLGEKYTGGISVKNNSGSIAVRNKWMKRGYPHYVVKDMEPKDYQQYLREKTAEIASSAQGTTAAEKDDCDKSNNTGSTSISISNNPACGRKKTSNFAKDVSTLSGSEYVATKLLSKNCLPPRGADRHYPPSLSKNSAFVSYADLDEANTKEKWDEKVSGENLCTDPSA